MISEAKAFWDAISGKVKALVQKETENALRVQRYDVTTAPNGSVMGVKQPFGANEIFLRYSKEVASATVGDTVLVAWWGSMSNAKVYYFADGYEGAEGGAAPVTSVNGQTGAVELDAGAVGAADKSWTRITGASTASSETLTYPADATELLIKAFSSNGAGAAYYCCVPVDAISNVSIIQVGGYYYSSSDYGLANVNHNATNRTIAYRNLRYAGTVGGAMVVYWR